MSIVVDYSAGRISPAALIAAGVVGVSRYLSVAGLSKVIHKPEYDELRAFGIDVTLNWEQFANDWLGGAVAGAAHAAKAVVDAGALNYRNTSPHRVIVGSADFNMSRAQWLARGRGYAIAYAAGIRAGGYRPGVYGPWNVLQWVADEGIMDAFWQAGMSWAYDNNDSRPPKPPWPGAHFIQRRHITIGGTDTDLNDILVTPLWGATVVSGGSDNDMDATQDARLTHIEQMVQFNTSPWALLSAQRGEQILAVLSKVAIGDTVTPAEIEAIKAASSAGASAAIAQALPALVDALLSKLPPDTLSREQLVALVEEGVRDVFADAATPTVAPPAA